MNCGVPVIPWANAVQVAIANKPQSEPPCCCCDASKDTETSFPNLSGLISMLMLSKLKNPIQAGARALQIPHIRANHWIVASTIGCEPGEVRLFDSLYKSIDTETMELVSLCFGNCSFSSFFAVFI